VAALASLMMWKGSAHTWALGGAGAGEVGVGAVQVHRRRLQLGGAVGAEGVEEPLQGGAGHALVGPDDRAGTVVVAAITVR
jgi:hypothetical protein